MNEKIGKVTLNLDYYEGQDFYSDGVIEEHLLELVKHHEPEEYQDIILKEKNWAVMYHLSQQRENILEWYPITKEDSVLEIGAGCGAISGVLAKKAGRVVANDLSKMRSSINAWKNKEAENLEIVVGNFNTVSDNLGSVDKKVMNKIAETTGGVFVNVKNASDLASAMKTAATSYSDRTLLSIRYMKNMDGLYGILRILFLTIIGTLIGSAVLFAYMDDFSVPTILLGSVTGALLGSILLEIGLKIGVFQGVLWLILWSLFSITFGYRYPKKSEELSSDSVMPQGRVTDYFIHD